MEACKTRQENNCYNENLYGKTNIPHFFRIPLFDVQRISEKRTDIAWKLGILLN